MATSDAVSLDRVAVGRRVAPGQPIGRKVSGVVGEGCSSVTGGGGYRAAADPSCRAVPDAVPNIGGLPDPVHDLAALPRASLWWLWCCWVVVIACVCVSPAIAAPPGHIVACLDAAAQYHRVDPHLLRAIAAVESGFDATAMSERNRDGSHDIGLMQVNSRWLPRLARFGIDARRLREPCVSAYVGAWILADNIRRHGQVWRAVGAYNARSPERQVSYVRKVVRELARQSGGAAPP